MATKLDIVNNIMRRIREPQVATSSETQYAQLVSAIVADAYEEVLDEWNWRPVAKMSYMQVPGGKDRIIPDVTNVKYGVVPDGRLVTIREQGTPWGFSYETLITLDAGGDPDNLDTFFQENAVPMNEKSITRFAAMRVVESTKDPTDLPPTTFSIRPLPDETVELIFHSICKNDWTFALGFYARPSRLTADASSDGDNIEIPFRPVQELALMYVLNERGEEMGEPGNLAQGRYVQALGAAKEIDIKAGEHSNDFDWERD
jgi:hypothetical protein